MLDAVLVVGTEGPAVRRETEVFARRLAYRWIEQPGAMCLNLFELGKRVAEKRLLDSLREEAVALVVDASLRECRQQPVALAGEKDFECIRIGRRAQAEEFTDVEDDALRLDRSSWAALVTTTSGE